MLYDNAMLAWCYAEAFRQFNEPRYAAVARGVFDFVLREMTSPDGAFYTAFDAEVDSMEGLNYLWTKAEVESTLVTALRGDGPPQRMDVGWFCRVYGLDQGPNFADPHHGTGVPDKNILYLARPSEGEPSALLDPNLRIMRQALYEARLKRKQPLLDTKIITSWNALMIRAFAYGGQVLNEPRYADAAARAANFLLQRHRRPDGGLYRTSRDGKAKYPGFLDDYAFLAQALLALRDADAGGGDWAAHAEDLTRQTLQRFGDGDGQTARGFYFTEQGADDIIIRQKTATDSPLPGGNAVAAMVLTALGRATDARHTLAVFTGQMAHHGEGMSSMVQAALQYLSAGGQPFTVAAAPPGAARGEDADDDADRPLSPHEIAAGVVTARAAWAGPAELHLRLSILRGFHINAHDTGGADIPLIPTRVNVEGDPEESRGVSVEYPPGEEQGFAFADKPIRVYSGEVGIVVRFQQPPSTGEPVRLSLSYQPCDESTCLPPVTKRVEVAVSPPP
jgi:uncharacterized protein YyaL (SSP411 family)